MTNEFEALDRLEEAEEVDLRAWLCELTKIHMKRTPEQRAYRFIKTFMGIESPSEEAYEAFIGWFTNGFETEAKDKAMEKFFAERY
jgi:hypothetical protein